MIFAHDDEPQPLGSEINYVVSQVYPKYAKHIELGDLKNELYVYALGKGAKHIAKWREKDETHRIYLALFGAAKAYSEMEKAAKLGYDFDDLAWYTPEKLRGLLPIALDDEWDGITGESEDKQSGGTRQSAGREGGTLLAMVADVRTALKACPDARHIVEALDETDESYHDALAKLADWLGGEFPNAPGYTRTRRRAVSNAAAIAATGNELAGSNT